MLNNDQDKRYKKQDIVIKKDSALININNCEITTYQRKIINSFIFLAKQEIISNENARRFKTTLADIRRITGIKNTNLKFIKESVKLLQNIIIEYNVTSKSHEEWNSFAFISGVRIKYNKKSGAAHIEYEFPFQILEAIQKPNIYAYIDLSVVKGLKNKYSIALYELSRDYYKIRRKKFTVNEFKILIGVGVKYSTFNMFEKRVLKPSIHDVNIKTEFSLSYVVHCVGNKKAFVELVMTLKENKQSLVNEQLKDTQSAKKTKSSSSINSGLCEKLIYYGIPEPQIQSFLNDPEIGEKGIVNGLEYFEKNLQAGKIHTNKRAYLGNAISKKWGVKTPEEEAKENDENEKTIISIKIEQWKDIVKYKKQKQKASELENLEKDIEKFYKKIGRPDYKEWRSFL